MDPRLVEFYDYLLVERSSGECVYTEEQQVVARETAQEIVDQFVALFGTPDAPTARGRVNGR